MKDLVIIGAGGFGRELFSAAREAVGFGEQFRVKGYLDANPAALDRFTGYPPSSVRPKTTPFNQTTCSSPPSATSPPAAAAWS